MLDKLAASFLGGLINDMRDHPWTALAALVALGMAMYNWNTHAKAADMAAVQVQLTEILAGQMEVKLLDARVRYCQSSNAEGRTYFRNLTAEYQERYRKLAGRDYDLPSCDDI